MDYFYDWLKNVNLKIAVSTQIIVIIIIVKQIQNLKLGTIFVYQEPDYQISSFDWFSWLLASNQSFNIYSYLYKWFVNIFYCSNYFNFTIILFMSTNLHIAPEVQWEEDGKFRMFIAELSWKDQNKVLIFPFINFLLNFSTPS